MKKCTLCIDRIYNENLTAAERLPARVATCPVGARHFGDLGDPTSDVAKLVASRGGFDLMPELGYRPTNKYLPPRRATGCSSAPAATTESPAPAGTPEGKLLGWLDRLFSR